MLFTPLTSLKRKYFSIQRWSSKCRKILVGRKKNPFWTSLWLESYVLTKFGQKSCSTILENASINWEVLKHKCKSDCQFSWDTTKAVFVIFDLKISKFNYAH